MDETPAGNRGPVGCKTMTVQSVIPEARGRDSRIRFENVKDSGIDRRLHRRRPGNEWRYPVFQRGSVETAHHRRPWAACPAQTACPKIRFDPLIDPSDMHGERAAPGTMRVHERLARPSRLAAACRVAWFRDRRRFATSFLLLRPPGTRSRLAPGLAAPVCGVRVSMDLGCGEYAAGEREGPPRGLSVW